MSYDPTPQPQHDPRYQYPAQQQPYQRDAYPAPVTPGYQQPPPGWVPPPAPVKKRTSPLVWILACVGGVVVLCLGVGLIGALTSGGNKTPSARGPENTPAGAQTTKNTGAAKAAQPKTAGMGDKARDGKFEFVVTGVDCTKSKVGDEFLNKTAQGKFCIVSVTVTNIGNEAQTFDGSNQTAYAGSTKFENDGTAEMYLNSDTQTFLEGINPGNTVKGKLVFDVPKSTKLTSIELHDSFFSGGVKVSLG